MKLLWLRWLGVLPVAIVAFVLSIQAMRLLHHIGPAVSRKTLAGLLIWNILFPLISYVMLTVVGVRVAPSHHRLVGVLLFVMTIGLAAFQMTGLLIDYGYSPWHWVFFGSALVGSMVGAFLGVAFSRSRYVC